MNDKMFGEDWGRRLKTINTTLEEKADRYVVAPEKDKIGIDIMVIGYIHAQLKDETNRVMYKRIYEDFKGGRR